MMGSAALALQPFLPAHVGMFILSNVMTTMILDAKAEGSSNDLLSRTSYPSAMEPHILPKLELTAPVSETMTSKSMRLRGEGSPLVLVELQSMLEPLLTDSVSACCWACASWAAL